MDCKQAAHRYIQRGWCVFPVRGSSATASRDATAEENSKRPAIATWKPFQSRYPTKEELEQWAWSGIAVVCGQISGNLLVVDIDDVVGEAAASELDLPQTVEARSPNGRHLYYVTDDPCPRGGVKLRPGLDIRAEGNYIIAPPTHRTNGASYEWIRSPDDHELAPVPAQILELIHEDSTADRPNLQEVLSGVAEGARDVSGASIAGSLIAQGYGRDMTLALLKQWNSHNEPPLAKRQLEKIVDGVLKQETKHVRLCRFTDRGNAEFLANLFHDDLLYCWPWEQWFYWDGASWVRDKSGRIYRYAMEAGQRFRSTITAIEDPTVRDAAQKHARKMESARSIEAMIRLARSDMRVVVMPDEFDTDPWILPVMNGVVDLQTGEFRDATRDDLVLNRAGTWYDDKARCPKWHSFLEDVIPSSEVRAFLQRAVGYSLTGDVSEQVLFFLFGLGANGKSTFLETVMALLGDYSTQAAPDLLLTQQRDTHPAKIANLFRKRFVVCTEIGQHATLDSTTMKRLTGGETRTARRMRENPWDYTPTDKFWIGANNKPNIEEQTVAVWRRINLIPFTQHIPKASEVEPTYDGPVQNPDLPAELKEELPGILNWALEGCKAWQEHGLEPPVVVQAATDKYQREADVIQAFLDDMCVLDGEVSATQLYESYKAWCRDTGEEPVTQRAFGTELSNRDIERARDTRSGRIIRKGIHLRA